LKAIPLQEREYTYEPGRDFTLKKFLEEECTYGGCSRGVLQDIDEVNKRTERLRTPGFLDFEEFWNKLNAQPMASLNAPVQTVSLSDDLRNQSRLAPSLLASNYFTPIQGIERIATGNTFSAKTSAPTLGGVAPHQWSQIVFANLTARYPFTL